jgi:hypothetical protein
MGHDGQPLSTSSVAVVVLRAAPVAEKKVEGVVSEITRKETAWLWPWRIAYRHLTLLEGAKGTNKGTMLLDLATRLSVGAGMPCSGDKRPRRPVNSVFFVGEDPLDETFSHRCDAAGGDTSRIFAYGLGYKLPRDWKRMEAIVRQHQARFLVIDPVPSFIGSMYHGVREALEPVSQFLQAENVACVLTRHLLYKSAATTARARGVGSFDFTNLCRSTLLLAPHPENGDERVLVHTDTNLGPRDLTIGFRTTDAAVVKVEKGRTMLSAQKSIRIERWFTTKQWTQEQILRSRPISTIDSTIDWLRDILKGGPKPAQDVRNAANARNVSLRTLETAKRLLRVRSTRKPWTGPGTGSNSEWSLP